MSAYRRFGDTQLCAALGRLSDAVQQWRTRAMRSRWRCVAVPVARCHRFDTTHFCAGCKGLGRRSGAAPLLVDAGRSWTVAALFCRGGASVAAVLRWVCPMFLRATPGCSARALLTVRGCGHTLVRGHALTPLATVFLGVRVSVPWHGLLFVPLVFCRAVSVWKCRSGVKLLHGFSTTGVNLAVGGVDVINYNIIYYNINVPETK